MMITNVQEPNDQYDRSRKHVWYMRLVKRIANDDVYEKCAKCTTCVYEEISDDNGTLNVWQTMKSLLLWTEEACIHCKCLFLTYLISSSHSCFLTVMIEAICEVFIACPHLLACR